MPRNEESKEKEKNKEMPWTESWLISGVVLLFLIAMIFMIIATQKKPQDEITSTAQPPIAEEDKRDEKNDDTVFSEKNNTKISHIVLPPMVSAEELQDLNEIEYSMEIQPTKTIEKVPPDLPLVGIGFGDIGVKRISGYFSSRSGGGKRIAIIRGGGSRATESAVDWALWWLATHQEDEGHWDSSKWEGAGTPEVNATCTGLALLAFLGAGHRDRASKFKANVKKNIDWLLKAQRPDGSFGNRNDTNGICTIALAEAYGMGCRISEIRKPLELAVDFLLKQQNDSGGFDYVKTNTHDDMSVSGWCIMSLKLASFVGIRENDIKAAFKKFEKLMDEQKETTGDNTPNSKGLSWSNLEQGKHNQEAPQTAVAAIAMLMRQHLGWKRTEPWLQAVATGQANHLPLNFDDMDVYRIYYAHQALFQQGGKEWKAWNKPMSDLITKAQRMDGDFKGSWDNNGHGHMKSGGRILATALLCLSLEVYYRYQPIMR